MRSTPADVHQGRSLKFPEAHSGRRPLTATGRVEFVADLPTQAPSHTRAVRGSCRAAVPKWLAAPMNCTRSASASVYTR